jgi:PAS domain S-box-containing protein
VSSVATILYVGSAVDALALADELPTDAVTVLSVRDPEEVRRLLDGDRVDCAVRGADADTETAAALSDAAVPLVAHGPAVDEAAATVPADAGADALAADVSALLAGDLPASADGDLDPVARLRRVLDRVDDGFFAVDTDWRLTYFNASGAEMANRDPDALVGESLWTAFPGAPGTAFEERYRTAMATGEAVDFEAYYEPHEAWYGVTAYPDADGLSVYFRDVTERKAREADRRRKTRALEAAPIGVTISDPDQEDNPLVFVNDAFCSLTGYDEDEVLGRNCRFLQGPETDPETTARLREAIDAGEPVQVEIQNYRRDGTPFWNRLDVAPVRDEDGAITNFVGFQQDVTDSRERAERLRSLTETISAMMLAGTDADVAGLAVTATTDALDLPWTTVWRYEEAENAFTALAGSAAAEGFADGTLPVETGTGDARSAADTRVWDAFVDGELRTVEPSSDGPSDAFPLAAGVVAPLSDFGVLVTGSPEPEPLTDRTVGLVRILATSTEAALLRAERERELQRQIDRLDEFVGVVSHDLRNPLQVAQTRLQTYFETGDEQHLDHVADSHDRMARLIEDVLTLAREGKAVSDPEQVTLATVAAQAWAAVDAPDATLETPTSATLVADPDRLRRLFENLFRNAVEHGSTGNRNPERSGDAVEHGSTRPRESGDGATVRVDTFPNGFYVADDGPGIPADERETVFEKGYTTSEEGTGFGLGIVRGIAEAHGWTVAATESEDGGARFEVTGISTLT